jgi:hypothetical protein
MSDEPAQPVAVVLPGDAEIEALYARANIAIPEDLKAGAIAEARGLARATALLRTPRTAASEPSNIFSLVSYT